MTRTARVRRDIAALAVVVGLFLGTFVWQTDDTWPLAQMRMFPGGSESAIALTVIKADLANGKEKEMNPFAFHLKRADIEGQMNRIRERPQMLGDLIAAYNRTVPAHSKIERITLVRREWSGGRTRGVQPSSEEEIVSWPG